MTQEEYIFSQIEPDRVNDRTILLCEEDLKEPTLKRFFRFLYSKYLQMRYCINPLGKDFRWGDGKNGILGEEKLK